MKSTEITIKPSLSSSYGQIMRAAISGMSACAKVKDAEHLEMFRNILTWAQTEYAAITTAACKHGPAQG